MGDSLRPTDARVYRHRFDLRGGPMPKPYSQELRMRVIETVEGGATCTGCSMSISRRIAIGRERITRPRILPSCESLASTSCKRFHFRSRYAAKSNAQAGTTPSFCRQSAICDSPAPRGDGIEETPGERFHTIFQSRRCHQCRRLDTLRPIEKHTAAGRTRKQDFLQKQTLPASDVDYSRKCFEVVRLQHGARVSKRIARHRTIGNGLFFGMLLAIRPPNSYHA